LTEKAEEEDMTGEVMMRAVGARLPSRSPASHPGNG